MIEIISPEQYKKIPWKNGKGETSELAISAGGTIDEFDWRISIASVVADGPFSDFTGYMRNLVLIEGAGIKLHHNESSVENLDHFLAAATFEGGCKTVGTLNAGPITDFNLMTKIGRYAATVKTYPAIEQLFLELCDLCFLYSHNRPLTISSTHTTQNDIVPAGHLIKIYRKSLPKYVLSGQNLIAIYLNRL